MNSRRCALRKRRAACGGFTLLELLVAVALTLFFAGLMVSVTATILQWWGREQADQSRALAAKQVLDLLERDLQAAVWRRDANHWLAVDVITDGAGLANHGWLLSAGAMKPAGSAGLRMLPDVSSTAQPTEDLRFGLSGAWLRFVTTNVESAGGLPVVVAYQLARRPVVGNPVSSNPAPVHYALYRSVVSSSESFANGYDVLVAAYGSTGNNPASALSTAYRLPRNVTNPSHANLLASNVVDFGCRLYARDSTGALVRIFPQDAGDLVHHVVGNGLAADALMPDVVDVFVRIMGESGLTAVEAIESGLLLRPPQFASDADWWWGVVEANSRVFVRRVELKGGAR